MVGEGIATHIKNLIEFHHSLQDNVATMHVFLVKTSILQVTLVIVM